MSLKERRRALILFLIVCVAIISLIVLVVSGTKGETSAATSSNKCTELVDCPDCEDGSCPGKYIKGKANNAKGDIIVTNGWWFDNNPDVNDWMPGSPISNTGCECSTKEGHEVIRVIYKCNLCGLVNVQHYCRYTSTDGKVYTVHDDGVHCKDVDHKDSQGDGSQDPNTHDKEGKCATCKGKGKIEETQHKGIVVNYDDTYHWQDCDVCGIEEITLPRKHTLGTNYINDGNGRTHTRKCTYKGCEYKETGNHTLSDWIDNGDGKTHRRYCTDNCGYEENNKNHNWINGICEQCKATKPVQECQHTNWKWFNTDPNKHWKVCTEPNCGQKISTEEVHTGGTHADGKCTVCGAQYQNHGNAGTTSDYVKNENTHKPVYNCKQNGCTEKYYGNEENHNMNWKDNQNGTHSGKCTVCGYEKNNKSHTFVNNGITCDDCGAVKQAQECAHDYKLTNCGTYHCLKCTKCSVEKDPASHTLTPWTDNNDGTHSRYCSANCGYQENNKPHTFVNNGTTCDDCGATKTVQVCAHNYIMKDNDAEHWYQCTECNITNSKEAHKITKWTDNGDGTHTGKCTVCGREITEKHTNGGNSSCAKCPYKVTTKPGDETQAGSSIPQTGENNIGIISTMVVLIGVAITSLIRFKRIK